MLIEVTRYSTTDESTLGTVSVDGKFECYSIEDPFRAVKEKGVTRIPEGVYSLRLRDEGGMNERYSSRYDFHQGMLWLQDVPEFEWVYIHVGNQASQSEGCILVGDSPNNNTLKKGFVGSSGDAYSRLYKKIHTSITPNDQEVAVQVSSFG